jgi:hypothetical protein
VTVKDAAQVLAVLRANLPSAFLQMTEEDAAFMATEWAQMFEQERPELVLAAARTYCYRTTNGKTFPAPGQIRELVQEIQRNVDACASGMPFLGKDFPPAVTKDIIKSGKIRYQRAFGSAHPWDMLGGLPSGEE